MAESSDAITQSINRFAQVIQNIISLVLGLASLLISGGFIVVNSHLANYTGIHGYNVRPTQYLVAGIGLLMPLFLAATFILSIYYFGRFIGAASLNIKQPQPPDKEVARDSVFRTTMSKIKLTAESRRFRMLLFTMGLIIYTILFGLFYGVYVYGSVPYYLGGGRPEPMVLVFDAAETPEVLGLTVDPVEPRRTRTVLLLAELTNGVLVADTVSGRVVAVKNETLTGLIGDRFAEQLITPTPLP